MPKIKLMQRAGASFKSIFQRRTVADLDRAPILSSITVVHSRRPGRAGLSHTLDYTCENCEKLNAENEVRIEQKVANEKPIRTERSENV